jgi:hypothetical protein
MAKQNHFLQAMTIIKYGIPGIMDSSHDTMHRGIPFEAALHIYSIPDTNEILKGRFDPFVIPL